MKAKIKKIHDTTGLVTAYWGKFVGRTYKVIKVIAKNNGDSVYYLDMGVDGIKVWYSKEIKVIEDEEEVEVKYER